MQRLRLLVRVILISTIIAAAGAIWVGQVSPPSALSAPADRVPGSHDALAFVQAARQHGVKSADPGAFYRGFRHARGMKSVKSGSLRPAWRPLGPMNWGGRTLALAIDPENPQTIYAGSASGGLWRSDCGGQGAHAWRGIDTGYPVLGVAAIALDPDDPATILIGTGEVYSYQTGIPSVGERLMRGSFGIGILKSSDAGATWEPSLDWRYDQRSGVQAIEFDPVNPDVVWAATTEGVYRSSDRAATWERSLDVVMATDIAIYAANPDWVIVACGGMRSPGYGLYRTQDGGQNWARMTQGLPGDFGGKAKLGVAASAPATVYATFGAHPYDPPSATSYLARSDNFGSTWRTVSDQDFASYQGFYSHFVGVKIDDPEAVLVGGVTMWHSDSGGYNLAEMDLLLTDNEIINTMTLDGQWVNTWADNHAIELHPSDPDIYYVGADQGIFRTGNGGASFERCVGGYQTTQFYNGMGQSPSDPDRLWASIQDWCGIGYTGSDDWYLDDLLFEGGGMQIDPGDEENRYSSYYYLNPMYRYNHGAVIDITPPGTASAGFSSPFVLAPSNPQVLYAGKNVVLKSTNRGQSWAVTGSGRLNPDPYNPALSMAISYQDLNRVYVSTAPFLTGRPAHHRARMYRTVNGGATWEDISGSLPDRFIMDIVVDPADHDQVYLALSGFGSSHVFGSSDGGLTWDDLDAGGLSDVPTSALALDPEVPERIYVGNDLGVFVSSDRGASWQAMSRGLPSAVMVFDLVFFAPDRLLRAGTHGNGAYEVTVPIELEPSITTEPPRRPAGRI